MSAARESRGSRRYLRDRKIEFDPREEVQRDSSATRQANEAARSRAQALTFRQLPREALPAMAWIAHQLAALGRKGGLQC